MMLYNIMLYITQKIYILYLFYIHGKFCSRVESRLKMASEVAVHGHKGSRMHLPRAVAEGPG